MRPLQSHFRADALTTLDTVRKQTQEARGFRRAQAVREVVAGHHVNAVSTLFHFPNAALRQWVQRFAQQGLRACGIAPVPVGRAKSPAPSNSLSTTSSIKTRFSMGPVLPSGVVVNSRWSSPSKRASSWGGKGCAVL
jgi:helix-turn-helix protein